MSDKIKNFQYNINISQIGAIRAGINDQIDLIDLAIFDVMMKFKDWSGCRTIQDKGNIYFLFSWTVIPKRAPLLGIKSRSPVKKRIKKLIDCGLLIQLDDKKQSWYRIGKKYAAFLNLESLKLDEKSSKNEDKSGCVSKSHPVSQEVSECVSKNHSSVSKKTHNDNTDMIIQSESKEKSLSQNSEVKKPTKEENEERLRNSSGLTAKQYPKEKMSSSQRIRQAWHECNPIESSAFDPITDWKMIKVIESNFNKRESANYEKKTGTSGYKATPEEIGRKAEYYFQNLPAWIFEKGYCTLSYLSQNKNINSIINEVVTSKRNPKKAKQQKAYNPNGHAIWVPSR